MKPIFEYLDYRPFLADFYEEQKKGNYFYSYRYMAGKLDMDHSQLIKILNGTRHITELHIKPIAVLCHLANRQAQFLEALVQFCKAKTERQEKIFFERMLALKSYESQTLEAYQFEYFQKWYYAAIRSLLDYFKYKGDNERLAKALNPAITTAQAKKAIDLLLKLNLIQKEASGHYIPTQAHVSTGESWQGRAIETYQKETIELSATSIDRSQKNERDISSITMSVDKECFEDISRLTKEFRASVIKRVNEIPINTTDRVYQMNIQIIPLTTILTNLDVPIPQGNTEP